jgi:hypothetical protein
MVKTLSFFFNIDRTYITGISSSPDGFSLDYIDSTIDQINLENIYSEESKNGIAQLNKFIQEMEFKPTRVTATLPAETVFVTKFPGKKDYKPEEFKKLVDFEIRNAYPQFNLKDFDISLIPFKESKDYKQMMLAVIIQQADYKIIKEILEPIGLEITKFEISQFNAHNSLIFNYPEMREKNVAILGIQGQFLDLSVINGNELIYYNLSSIDSIDKIGEVFEREYNKIIKSYVDTIDACYFFGAGLNKNISMSLWETAMMLSIFEAKRLNPFRMMKTSLDSRHKEYCSRTFHIYPACAGATLPPWHDVIKI